MPSSHPQVPSNPSPLLRGILLAVLVLSILVLWARSNVRAQSTNAPSPYRIYLPAIANNSSMQPDPTPDTTVTPTMTLTPTQTATFTPTASFTASTTPTLTPSPTH